MIWVPTVSDADATGLCAQVYDRIRSESPIADLVANIYRSLSLRPEVMQAFYTQDRLVTWGGSGLERQEEEMVSTVVSSLNRCHY